MIVNLFDDEIELIAENSDDTQSINKLLKSAQVGKLVVAQSAEATVDLLKSEHAGKVSLTLSIRP